MIFGWVRNIGLIASIVMMMLGAAATSQAQWVRCGPQGGVVTSFAVMGPRLFAATSGNYYNNTPGSGVFVSMDSGITWKQSNAGLTDTSVDALGVSHNYLIASTASGSLFRSSDNGASWGALPSPNTSLPISSFTTLGTYLFAITGNDGVLRSTDDGMSWSRFAIDTGVLDIHTLVVMDTILFANGSWGDMGGVYRSTDYGATWTEVYNAVFDISVLGNKLFAAMYHTASLGVNVSTDQGMTWTGTEGGGCGVYNQMAAAGSVVFSFHSQNGVFFSIDSGADWISTNAFADFYAVAAMGTTLFVGNETGILRSTDNGNSWDTSNTGIYMFEPSILSQPYNFAVVGHTIIASNYQHGVRSSDGGTHWTIDTFATHNSAKYIVMGNVLLTTGLGGLYRSDDLGVTWRQVDNDGFFDPFLVAGAALFANVNFPDLNTTKLMRSMDTGRTWTDVGGSIDPGPYGFIDNLMLGFDGKYVYAATSVALYRSSDLGQTWTNLSGALIQGANAITANGGNICVASGNRMFRSTDGGASWSANDLNFSVNSFLQSGSNILAATDKGIYLSNNNGSTWGLAATGMMPDTNPAYAFGMIDSTIYVSTDNGIWKQQRSEIPFSIANSSVAEVADPVAIELSPNPTSGSLTIQGAVNSITITNLLGETVLDVPNSHTSETILDLSKLSPGTYFARMGTAAGVVIRKIVKE